MVNAEKQSKIMFHLLISNLLVPPATFSSQVLSSFLDKFYSRESGSIGNSIMEKVLMESSVNYRPLFLLIAQPF